MFPNWRRNSQKTPKTTTDGEGCCGKKEASTEATPDAAQPAAPRPAKKGGCCGG